MNPSQLNECNSEDLEMKISKHGFSSTIDNCSKITCHLSERYQYHNLRMTSSQDDIIVLTVTILFRFLKFERNPLKKSYRLIQISTWTFSYVFLGHWSRWTCISTINWMRMIITITLRKQFRKEKSIHQQHLLNSRYKH